ncbi:MULTISPECIES: ABC transporter permease [Bacillus]|uniref:ABC transporter, permease protein, putative n=3 Tax=Bacillus cereus group TaxID=86661 RepID=Q73BE4_BACC1|nr:MULTISPECIES: ABC transporter permease [Bacillus]AAS40403.1 ABC transporter, permease protein, putative [Bacillus cereus ATCC 10987]ASI77002.1 ABC transporter permease [Bacillus cereus]KMQ32992.1 ABC transporter permease [Bacillus cereus]KXY69325.1 ABC transporter permease [Bacillus cereus]KYQ01771.1 putative ABC transporter permease protein [Bacillus cereus]
MKPSLIYMYNINKKQIIISLLSFIFVVAVAFVSLGNYIKQESGEVRQTIIVAFVILVYITFLAMIVIQAVSAFGKMTESTLFRLTSISGKKIVLAILLYAVIYLLIFELIGSIFLYGISMKIIKGTELYEVLFTQSVFNPLKHLFSTMLYVFNLSSILLVLLFSVASVKVFSLKKKKLKYPMVFFLFLLVTKLLGTIYGMLGGLAPAAPLIKKLVYIDESSGADVFLYPEKLMNLYSLSFSIGIFILLVYITGRIIDKKLEV